jgi:hypothetical protein
MLCDTGNSLILVTVHFLLPRLGSESLLPAAMTALRAPSPFPVKGG